MHKFLIYIIALNACIVTNIHAYNDEYPETAGVLNQIRLPLTYAIEQAESLYEERGGAELDEPLNLLVGDDPQNQVRFIQTLIIESTYYISFKFSERYSEGMGVRLAVASQSLFLHDKEIKLIPIYNQGDAKITSWECITNADKDISLFMGSSETPEYSASFIREYTEHPQLSLCIYVRNINSV